MEKDSYPLFRMDNILDQLIDNSRFSTLDLKNDLLASENPLADKEKRLSQLVVVVLCPRHVRAYSRSYSTLSLARHFRTHNACSYSRQSHKWLKRLQSL